MEKLTRFEEISLEFSEGNPPATIYFQGYGWIFSWFPKSSWDNNHNNCPWEISGQNLALLIKQLLLSSKRGKITLMPEVKQRITSQSLQPRCSYQLMRSAGKIALGIIYTPKYANTGPRFNKNSPLKCTRLREQRECFPLLHCCHIALKKGPVWHLASFGVKPTVLVISKQEKSILHQPA